MGGRERKERRGEYVVLICARENRRHFTQFSLNTHGEFLDIYKFAFNVKHRVKMHYEVSRNLGLRY